MAAGSGIFNLLGLRTCSVEVGKPYECRTSYCLMSTIIGSRFVPLRRGVDPSRLQDGHSNRITALFNARGLPNL